MHSILCLSENQKTGAELAPAFSVDVVPRFAFVYACERRSDRQDGFIVVKLNRNCLHVVTKEAYFDFIVADWLPCVCGKRGI